MSNNLRAKAAGFWLLISWLCACEITKCLAVAESGSAQPEATGAAGTNAAATIAAKAAPGFSVRSYRIEGDAVLRTNTPSSLFSKFTGTNLSLADIANAAAALQRECQKRGYSNVCVAVAPRQLDDGIVTLNVFRSAWPQILVLGERYQVATSASAPGAPPAAVAETKTVPAAATNISPRFTVRAYELWGETLLPKDTLASIFTK